MIYTLTLNPAVDYIMYPENLSVGGINRSKGENIYFGGKGINVSCVLKELGVNSVALGFVAGFTGKALEEGLAEKGINTAFVRLSSGITRINVKLRTDAETDINGNGPQIHRADLESLYRGLENLSCGDILVLSGSVPNSLPSDIYEIIMKRLAEKNIKFVVDASGDLLLNSLKYRPFLIKPNNDELSEIFGVEINSRETALEYAHKLKETGAVNVLISMGKKGALLLDETGKEYYCEAFKGQTVNTVGAGDSMVAGFLAGYLKTGDYAYALRLGTASGGATAFSEGLATRKQIEKLTEK